MGGFLGLGNSSAKTDRGNQLAGVNAEWNIYNRGLPLADKTEATGQAVTQQGLNTVGTGVSTLDSAKQYWQNILQGSRPQVMRAAQPAITAATDEADAARAQQGQMGTARGGGVNALNQQAQSNQMATTENIIAGQQPQAAKALESVGGAQTSAGGLQAGVGQAEIAKALQELGLSKDVADEITNSSIQSRPISQQANAAVRQQWSDFLTKLGMGL